MIARVVDQVASQAGPQSRMSPNRYVFASGGDGGGDLPSNSAFSSASSPGVEGVGDRDPALEVEEIALVVVEHRGVVGPERRQPFRSRIGRALSGLSTTNANIARSPQRPRNRWP